MVQAYLELLKSWKDVRGRMRRDKFWEAFTCNVFIVVLLVMFTMRIGGVFEYIQMIYQIVTTVPFVTGAIRRLHDMGENGMVYASGFHSIYRLGGIGNDAVYRQQSRSKIALAKILMKKGTIIYKYFDGSGKRF